MRWVIASDSLTRRRRSGGRKIGTSRRASRKLDVLSFGCLDRLKLIRAFLLSVNHYASFLQTLLPASTVYRKCKVDEVPQL